MSKKKKNSQPIQESDSGKGLRRKVVTAIRWAAWILVLCLLLTQLTGNAPGDLATLGQFVIAGLFSHISSSTSNSRFIISLVSCHSRSSWSQA